MQIGGNDMRKGIGLDETVIVRGEAHFMKAIVPIFIAAFCALGFFGSIGELPLSDLAGIILVEGMLIGGIVLYLKYCGIVLTDKRIFGNKGLLKTKTLSSPISKITNVSVNQSLLGKVLGYGTIYIDTISGNYAFKYIKKPMDLHNAIIEQTSRH
jgi:uncharacterized membrane protein YdbT with pleckstrin-like domain